MKYLASVSYDGSKFFGFQRLNEDPSVQYELEKALTKINKSEVFVKGAGRTDRGVHALDQKVHFELDVNVPVDRLANAINSLLSDYVRVNDVKIVDEDFHARFSVKEKTYEYIINLGNYDPIKNDYLYNYNRSLNIKAMKKASKYLLGLHSFEGFTAGGRDNYDSMIYSIKFKKKNDLLYISFNGKSFYRYMVRNLVGAIILAGQEKIKPEDIKKVLLERKNVINYVTAPPNGLYLKKIEY